MALSPTARDDLGPSASLVNFPTPLHYNIRPESQSHEGWVFWSQDEEGSQIISSSADLHPTMPYDIIISAFSQIRGNWKLIVQLWAPVTIGGRRLLSTSGQPFALSSLDNDDLRKYRLRSMKYHYNIDVNNQLLHTEEEEENPMILSGGPAAAFLNCMPEFARLKDHQGSPLAPYAFEECGLETSFMMPICYASETSSCVGVVECTSRYPYFIIMKKMRRALEEENVLRICAVQECIPYKTINGLKPARDEIETALEIICESHNLDVAQVWIAYEDENHEPFSSSMEDTRTKRMIVLKLTGYLKKDSFLIDDGAGFYYNFCDVVHLETGEELVEQTLKDYKPRLCKNINYLGDHTQTPYALIEDIEASAVAICLRSINTGDLDYAFEFIWHHPSNNVIMLEALLLTLKRCLPCFKFASGAELGDELELFVIDDFRDSDAEDISESEIRSFMIFQEKNPSSLRIALAEEKKPMVVDYSEAKLKTAPKQLPRGVIEEQFGNTMKKAAENLNVSLSTLKRKCKGFGIKEWQGRPNVVKKGKVNASSNNQSNRNEEAIQEPSIVNKNENTLTIKAKYADDTIKFKLHISEATFVNVEKDVGVNFNLTLGTFKLNYCDEDGDWILLRSDQHMKDCLESLRNLGRPVVQLRVIPSTQ